MRSGKIARLHRAALEEPTLDGPFDRHERGFDTECIVRSVVQGFGTGEQPTGLPQLEGFTQNPSKSDSLSSVENR